MSPELDRTLVWFVNLAGLYVALEIVRALATLFLSILTYFKTESALKTLSRMLASSERPKDKNELN